MPDFATLLLVALSAAPSPELSGPTAPVVPAAPGKVYMTPEEALELAFPKCEIERQRVFLTKEQKTEIEKRGDVELESRIVFPYVARKDGKVVGTAYFDTHLVRTMRETLMFVVEPDHTIGRVEMLAFGEPVEYVPRTKWYAQFPGKRLEDGITLKKAIKGVTGATLTATATTDAARRSLALQAVLFPKPGPGE